MVLKNEKTEKLTDFTVELSPFVLLSIYVSAYLLSTEVVRGSLGTTRYEIRLFRSVCHYRLFIPLLDLEQRLRPTNPEFSGQVRSGASLPPPIGDESR